MTSPRVHLREITGDNREAVSALRVRKRQKRFVASVARSLKDATRPPEDNPWYRAVYLDDEPVGCQGPVLDSGDRRWSRCRSCTVTRPPRAGWSLMCAGPTCFPRRP
jgi:hypothetical protein